MWRYICKPLGHFVNCSRVLFVFFFANLLGLVYVVFISVNSYFWILVIVKLNVNPNSLNTIHKIQSAYWTPHVSNILFLILIWLACHHTFLIIIVNAYTIILHDDSIHRKITKYVIILLWTYTIDFLKKYFFWFKVKLRKATFSVQNKLEVFCKNFTTENEELPTIPR